MYFCLAKCRDLQNAEIYRYTGGIKFDTFRVSENSQTFLFDYFFFFSPVDCTKVIISIVLNKDTSS